MKRTLLVVFVLAALQAPALGEISRSELKEALKRNPDLLLEVIRENRKEFFKVMMKAMREAQDEEMKARQEQARLELEKSFKNPLKPKIDSSTRIRGNKRAKITLIEYSDFQCPYCKRGYQNVEKLRKKYGKELRFVYKHLPLPNHPMALPAAQFMEAISLQSEEKAWQFHDELFNNQGNLSKDFFVATAKKLGVDVERVKEDAASSKIRKKIDADIAEAKKFKIEGTPGFLVNGVPLRGAYPVEKFEEIIERLKK